jgi:prephenate dehydrogenase
MKEKMKIAIIGYGRFGSLLAKLLKPYGQIFVMEKKNIRFSEKKVSLEGLKDMDMIIPAVPISSLEKVLKQIERYLSPGTIVMDVASVKVLPCQWLSNMRKDLEVVGCHPMFGPDSAVNGLKGLQTIICPLRIKHDTLKKIKDIWTDMGVSVMVTSPRQHDQEAAKSLAMVHFLGRGLTKLKVGPQTISSLGFERLLKVNETVENDTLELFIDMNRYNPFAQTIRQKYLSALSLIDRELVDKELKHDISGVRQQIDLVDSRIAESLKQRMSLSVLLGKIKKGARINIRDAKREESVIAKVASQSRINKKEIKSIYEQIFRISRKLQK